MEEVIRLGYEEFLENPEEPGVRIPAVWFFGKQGVRGFELYSDFVYQDIKAGKNTEYTRWYFRERDTVNKLECNSYGNRFITGLYKDFINAKQSFLVPIRIVSHQQDTDFRYLYEARLPEDLLNYIHEGKATVVFYTLWEGNIDKILYQHIQAFIGNNGLCKNEVWVVTSSFRRDIVPSFSNRSFGVYNVNYFGQDLWFLPGHENKLENQEKYKADLQRFRYENLTVPKEKKFLCFNRRLMPHRAFIASFISSHPGLVANSFYSFGIGVQYLSKDNVRTDFLNRDVREYVGSWVWDKYKQDPKLYREIGEVSRFLDSNKNRSALVACDKTNDILQLYENPVELKEDFYRKAFVNIITETFADARGYQFITEKTTKTLYAQMPFLAIAPAGFLETLHRLGYQTFENYWDESYDSVEDDWLRYVLICKIIKELNLKSQEELFEMTKDMEPILYHNALLVSSSRNVKEFFSFLETIQNRNTCPNVRRVFV